MTPSKRALENQHKSNTVGVSRKKTVRYSGFANRSSRRIMTERTDSECDEMDYDEQNEPYHEDCLEGSETVSVRETFAHEEDDIEVTEI